MDPGDLVIIFLSLLFSALFSGLEIAFISANRLRIELEKKEGRIPARILSGLVKRPSRVIGSLLLGNNVALVVFGIKMAELLEGFLYQLTTNDALVVTLQTIISTLLILVTAEFIPKVLFRINPNRVLNLTAIILQVIHIVFWVPMIITIGLAQIILKGLLKVEVKEDQDVFGKVDVNHYLKEATEDIPNKEELDAEVQIFKNALNFADEKARECMVPRNEIVALEVNDNIDVLRQKFIDTGLSKILIYRDSIDNIIGYIHSSELFKHPDSLKSVLLPVFIVPETTTANDILEMFIQQSRSIAVVVDEFGGTSGMLTIEDVIEELFGEIEDEHDKEELIEVQVNESEFQLSGRHEIDYLNEKFGVAIPESDDYETLAGYILHNHENIPALNSVIEIDQFTFTITGVSDRKIEEVQMIVKAAV